MSSKPVGFSQADNARVTHRKHGEFRRPSVAAAKAAATRATVDASHAQKSRRDFRRLCL